MTSNVTVIPQLQPAGAGLPASELAWLRILFRCACRVMSRNAGLKWFTFEAKKMRALAEQVSAAQATVPVLIDRVVGIEDSSRYWSVFMVFDHLRIIDEGLTHIVHALSRDRVVKQEVRIQDVKPSPQSGPETIDRFVKAVDGYGAMLTRLPTLGRRVHHLHPWFGPMTAHDWHCLAAIHHWVHRRQLERIVEQLRGQGRTEGYA